MKKNSFGWITSVVGVEYLIAMFLVAYHYATVKVEPYGLNTLPVEFFTTVATCFIALVSLIFYTLAILIVWWKIASAVRIILVVFLLLPLLLSAGLLSIVLLIDMASKITIVAAFIFGWVVLQMPVLVYRLLASTR